MTENESIVTETEIKKIKVMLVDDHPIVRQGIRDVLENTGDITVCAETSSANEAITLINRDRPDIVIVDIMLEGNVNGIDLVKSIGERFPGIHTLILSMHDEMIYAERAIKAGARGYVMKDIAPRIIVDAIRTITKGELYLKEELSKKILDKVFHQNADKRSLFTEQLSDREFEVFELIGNGYSMKDISKKLNLSIYTVESHRKSIKKKMRIGSSSELTRMAIQWVIMQHR